MARSKATPVQRTPSSEYTSKLDRTPSVKREATSQPTAATNGHAATLKSPIEKMAGGFVTLVVCVAGIYGSFLTWAYLQEKLTTTPYGTANERWNYPVFLNTVQALFSAVSGFVFLYASTPRGQAVPPVIPNAQILGPLVLTAFTHALSSPFGYAALAHIDYITFILAKSCKLLPVMFLHITLFRRKFPLYKYLVVAAVTTGVAVFSLHSGKKHKASSNSGQTSWGLLLLGINLLFDGLTNSTQDHIFATFQPYSGPQMMCATNVLAFLLTGSYLLVSPWLVHTPLGQWFGMDIVGSSGELTSALSFLARHPSAWKDVLGFSLCGAVGQVFIFQTLSSFSSVLLITVTVTRKMFTMMLSVFTFGHRLTNMQWLGVALVFGGIGVEAGIARREKLAKEAARRAKVEKAQ